MDNLYLITDNIFGTSLLLMFNISPQLDHVVSMLLFLQSNFCHLLYNLWSLIFKLRVMNLSTIFVTRWNVDLMRTVLQIFNSTLVHIETFIFTSGALAKTENMSDVKIIVVNAKLYSVELNGRILWLLEISLYMTKFYSCTKNN